MAKTILGIDVGRETLKLALMKNGHVIKTASVQMPENLLRDGRIVSRESMSDILKKAMKEHGMKASQAAFVLPNEAVYVKNVEMPLMTIDQLRYNLPFEFNDYITGEVKDYVFDYAVLTEPVEAEKRPKKEKKAKKEKIKKKQAEEDGFSSEAPGGSVAGTGEESFGSNDAAGSYADLAGVNPAFADLAGTSGVNPVFAEFADQEQNASQGSSGQNATDFGSIAGSAFSGEYGEESFENNSIELMVVAAVREILEDAYEILKQAGLKLVIAAPAISAYISLIRVRQEVLAKVGEEYGILDLGYGAVRMYMFHQDRHQATRVLEIGLSSVDNVIAEIYGVDIHLAHTYLLTNYERCQERAECLAAYENIAVELMRALNFYRFSNPDSDLTDLWLCGGGAEIPMLASTIGEMLDKNLHRADELVPGGNEVSECNSYVQAIGITLG